MNWLKHESLRWLVVIFLVYTLAYFHGMVDTTPALIKMDCDNYGMFEIEKVKYACYRMQ